MSLNFENSGIQVTALDAAILTDACWAFEREREGRVVRFLRGTKMTDVRGVFDQFSAALQFPYYFGENWAAFSECIQDLSWLPANHYVLVVFDASEVLRATDADFATCVAALSDSCDKWPHGFDLGEPWARQPAKFQVLLQTAPQSADALERRLIMQGAIHRHR
jgi:hypothetical protein